MTSTEGEESMDMHTLKPGDKVRTVDGWLAEVLNETRDGAWIRVRYLAGPEDSALIGTEDYCHESELEAPAEVNESSLTPRPEQTPREPRR
jgi:hypothetical protein